MFCPQCGQQQVSMETRFCSRCGCLLTAVSEAAANDGLVLQSNPPVKDKKTLMRNLSLRGFLFGLQIFSLLLIFFAAITGAPEEVVTLLFGFAAGAFFSLLASFFLSNNPKFKVNSPDETSAAELNKDGAKFVLPPLTSQPVSNYAPPANSWKSFTTNDLAPHSVTDKTTKLLNKDE